MGGYLLARDGEAARPAAAPAERWKTCGNEQFAFEIGYPGGWHTASALRGGECLFFDPEPFEVPKNSDFSGTALEVQPTQQSFETIVDSFGDERFNRAIARRETTAAGRKAVAFEVEATGEGLLDRGTRQYAYVVDRGGQAFVVQTTDGAERDFRAAKRVVDRAAASLRFTGSPRVQAGLPDAVEHTRAAIVAAAESRDHDALRELISATGFRYTFGGPVAGGAVAYWQELERTTDEEPLESLAEVLRMPYTLHRGLYVWPFAFDKEAGELTAYERELLRPLGRGGVFVGESYYGWRAGIEPDGDWVFFVAGD